MVLPLFFACDLLKCLSDRKESQQKGFQRKRELLFVNDGYHKQLVVILFTTMRITPRTPSPFASGNGNFIGSAIFKVELMNI